MKNFIKFYIIFVTFTALNLQSSLPLVGDYADQIAYLSNPQYPTDAPSSEKNIHFIAPDYAQDMYLYIFYPNQNNRDVMFQRLDISKNNHFTIKLLEPNKYVNIPITPYNHSINLYLIPQKIVEKYIDELKTLTQVKDGLSDHNAVNYINTKEQNEKLSNIRQELNMQSQFIAQIYFEKISNGDKINLPVYAPKISDQNLLNLPKSKTLTETAPTSKTSTKMIPESNERILTLRIPEQEIQVGVRF